MGKFYIYDKTEGDFRSDKNTLGEWNCRIEEAYAWPNRSAAEYALFETKGHWQKSSIPTDICILKELRPAPERNYVVKNDQDFYSAEDPGDWVDDQRLAARFTRDDALKLVGYVEGMFNSVARIVKIQKKI